MIYPENFPTDRNNEIAEKNVYDYMRRLPKHFDVFYNVKFSARSSGERADYEIDFIVADLRNNHFNGVVCIEVKGGNLIYNGEGFWTQNGNRLSSPTDQVVSAKHNLLKRYTEVTKKVPFGWMVCFPDSKCPSEEKLPSSLSESQVIDAYTLKELAHSLTYYFDKLIDENRTRAGLDIVSYEKHFKSSLTQNCSFVLPLSGRINVDEEVLIRLTNDQFRILNSTKENNRLLVKGTAGTGKTLIAKEIAQEGIEKGLNVLFLCFNKVLSQNIGHYFKKVLQANNNIRVDTYHSFANYVIGSIDSEWWNKSIHLRDFWTYEVPLKIEILNGEHKLDPIFDLIIIDEGQDFTELMYTTALYFLKEHGKFYIFMDEFQNINQACSRVPDYTNIPKVRLEENCRNTRNIAQKLTDIIGYDIKSKDGIPNGKDVMLIGYKNQIEQQTKILREIKTLIDVDKIRADQILIMLNTDFKSSCLSNTGQIAALPLISLNDNGILNNHSIQYTQISTFKGLEADVVFIIDTDKVTFDEKVFYTQASRAKHLLYIFEKEID